jgi:hypothetical protein
MTAAAGSSSLCMLSRDDAPRPATTYHQGAAVALAQVRHALDSQLGSAPGDQADARPAPDAWQNEAVGNRRGSVALQYPQGYPRPSC